MSASVSGEVRAEPNLTPLLDVVFQLITFFMLCVNFSQDNYNQSIKLPVAGSAKPADANAGAVEDRLILNIDRDGRLLYNGKQLDTAAAIQAIADEAKLLRLNLEVAGKGKIDPAVGLPSTVVIRADRDTECTDLYQLITACQAHGYRKFELKAMSSSN